MVRFSNIRFTVIQDGSMNREEMLRYFSANEEQQSSVIAIYRNEKYKGIITYKSLSDHMELEQSINTEILYVSEQFWVEAKKCFDRNQDDILAILDKRTEQILGFIYDDKDVGYDQLLHGLSSMETGRFVMPLKYQHVQQVVIVGMNELAWKCYLSFSRQGEFDICTVGKEWEWFGIEGNHAENPDYVKMYIYAEEASEEKRKCSVADNFKFVYEIGVSLKVGWWLYFSPWVPSNYELCK